MFWANARIAMRASGPSELRYTSLGLEEKLDKRAEVSIGSHLKKIATEKNKELSTNLVLC